MRKVLNEGEVLPARKKLKEIRYPLTELLRELREEEKGSLVGQEMVDQTEIGKLFTRKRRSTGRGSKTK